MYKKNKAPIQLALTNPVSQYVPLPKSTVELLNQALYPHKRLIRDFSQDTDYNGTVPVRKLGK